MRKSIKTEINEITKLMDEAHAEIFKDISGASDYESAADITVECQNCAVAVGTLLEDDEAWDRKLLADRACSYRDIVSMLEEYCELAYQLHEKLAAGGQGAATACQALTEQFGDIRTKLTDIPVKKEAVFLPYNASMWDSLESVYLKLAGDAEWEAFVAPIPYFDRDVDGKLSKIHYEGGEFPAEIPITDYKDYDLKKRHPDRIYIHNPYDGSNYVTSVHPFYYSKNIKKFTDELIYIPYFVLAEPSSPDARGYENFIEVPAVIHADTVIVQSEMMRNVYINTMVRNMGETTRRYWENKIKGTGSPKYDRIDRIRREGAKLPPEWEKKLYRADGSRKKIVLYNTSVIAMLRHREAMLKKIEYVLDVFRDNADDVLLLWRPHPLMKETLASMRPELFAEYNRIVDGYIREDFGIFDDTSDIDRAIAVSDAYYGDPSSVVSLCRHAGMPIMIQNPDIVD